MMIGKEEIIRTLDALANWQGSLSLTDKERVAIVTAMEAVKRQDKDVVPTEFHEKCMSKQLRRVAELEKQLKNLDRPHGEWIPCSERLPEKYGVYLATNSEGDVYEYDYSKFTVHDGKWSFLGRDVIAWMPLPKPYKEGGDEK